MKKLFSILIAGLAAAALLAGCGSSAATSAGGTSSAESAQSSTAGSAAASTGSAENNANAEEASSSVQQSGNGGGSVLVLYYSGTGNTKNIADMIASDTGADEFEITPSEPYTEDDLDWTDENSRVNKEHNDESLQDVAFDSYDVPNWDSYDTVFVGYPIWWQDASWVMKSYVQHLDFNGKTVIPFCTSSSSGLGDSGKNLESLAGSGTWLEGERFSGGASEDEVRSWVDSLNL